MGIMCDGPFQVGYLPNGLILFQSQCTVLRLGLLLSGLYMVKVRQLLPRPRTKVNGLAWIRRKYRDWGEAKVQRCQQPVFLSWLQVTESLHVKSEPRHIRGTVRVQRQPKAINE